MTMMTMMTMTTTMMMMTMTTTMMMMTMMMMKMMIMMMVMMMMKHCESKMSSLKHNAMTPAKAQT